MSTAPMASTRGLNVSTLTRPRLSTTTPLQRDDTVREDQPRRDRHEHDRDERGDEEPAVDGRHARAVARSRRHGEDADDRGDDADRRDDQREDQADVAEGHLAQDQRGDQGDGVRLEEVCRHAGAVADVVADVVGDGRGVAGVVLGDALLDLADEVGADVSGLGEDAATDTHEHREQRGTEAEALEDGRGVALVDEHDERGAEQAEADGEHARRHHRCGTRSSSRPARRRRWRPQPRGRCRGRRATCPRIRSRRRTPLRR